MTWTQEEIVNLSKSIKIDLNDSNLRKSLKNFKYSSIPAGIRDIANYVIDGKDINDVEKDIKKDGIKCLFGYSDQTYNVDYLGLMEHLSSEEIDSVYLSSLAMTLSTGVLSKNTLKKHPNLAYELSQGDNASIFLGIVNNKILKELDCKNLIHNIFYGKGNTPIIPIVDLSSSKFKNKPTRTDARQELDKAYADFVKKAIDPLGKTLSNNALKTIFCSGVLREIQKIQEQPNFKHYEDELVDDTKFTWGELLDNFKEYVQYDYMPRNCFKMPKNASVIRGAMDTFRDELIEIKNKTRIDLNQVPYLYETATYKKSEVAHIHHIFPQSKYEDLANQKYNFIALPPSAHYTDAHSDNDTKKVDPEFQQFALWLKFIDPNVELVNYKPLELGFLNIIDKVFNTNLANQEEKVRLSRLTDPNGIEFVELLTKLNPEYKSFVDNKYIRQTVIAQSYEKEKGLKTPYNRMIKELASNPSSLSPKFILNFSMKFMANDNEQNAIKYFLQDLEEQGLSKEAVIKGLIVNTEKTITDLIVSNPKMTSAYASQLAEKQISYTRDCIAMIECEGDWFDASNYSKELNNVLNDLNDITKKAFQRRVINELFVNTTPLVSTSYDKTISKVSESLNKYLTPDLIVRMEYVPSDEYYYGKNNYVEILYNELKADGLNLTKEEFANTIINNFSNKKDYALACEASEILARDLGVNVDVPKLEPSKALVKPIYDKYEQQLKNKYPDFNLNMVLASPSFDQLDPLFKELRASYNSEIQSLDNSNNVDIDRSEVLSKIQEETIEMFLPEDEYPFDLNEDKYKETQLDYIYSEFQTELGYSLSEEELNTVYNFFESRDDYSDGDIVSLVLLTEQCGSLDEALTNFDYAIQEGRE